MNTISLVELSLPGCHNCADFKKFWEEESINWPNVTLREVSIMTPEGQGLMQKHHVLASPGIIANDDLISSGPVDTNAFLQKLKELSG